MKNFYFNVFFSISSFFVIHSVHHVWLSTIALGTWMWLVKSEVDECGIGRFWSFWGTIAPAVISTTSMLDALDVRISEKSASSVHWSSSVRLVSNFVGTAFGLIRAHFLFTKQSSSKCFIHTLPLRLLLGSKPRARFHSSDTLRSLGNLTKLKWTILHSFIFYKSLKSHKPYRNIRTPSFEPVKLAHDSTQQHLIMRLIVLAIIISFEITKYD